MNNTSIIFALVIFGFIASYMVAISHVRGLRENRKNIISYLTVLLTCIVFGGPALLITYMFAEIREEDKKHHNLYLILGVVYTVLQILLVTLLVIFWK